MNVIPLCKAKPLHLVDRISRFKINFGICLLNLFFTLMSGMVSILSCSFARIIVLYTSNKYD